mmetsp:Transcript_28316/g.27246  ORF Transcript_28316/g.27246 Transcript_28316/m.27246 type:complete len:101 (-) Transcript_28316:1046-1348(-)
MDYDSIPLKKDLDLNIKKKKSGGNTQDDGEDTHKPKKHGNDKLFNINKLQTQKNSMNSLFELEFPEKKTIFGGNWVLEGDTKNQTSKEDISLFDTHNFQE